MSHKCTTKVRECSFLFLVCLPTEAHITLMSTESNKASCECGGGSEAVYALSETVSGLKGVRMDITTPVFLNWKQQPSRSRSGVSPPEASLCYQQCAQ